MDDDAEQAYHNPILCTLLGTYFFAEPAAIISRVVPRIGSRFGVGISACVHASSFVEGWRAVNVLRVRRVDCVGDP